MQKVLIANRGEIAVRVMRACRELGIATVAVYSDADKDALFVAYADEAVRLGPPPASQSYLSVEKLLQAAADTGADAIHPGYGFLAENPGFAAACADAGITFIGPSPRVLELMGSKVAARREMRRAGVPVVPGTDEPVHGFDEAQAIAGRDRLPGHRQAQRGRRRHRHEHRPRRGRPASRPSRPARPSPPRPSAWARSTSSGTSRARVTSRCRCWATATAT